MPLLDHFHPPLSRQRHWESFHSSWANEIMAMLNDGILPEGYFAETQVHVGPRIEVDVATMATGFDPGESDSGNGIAVVPFTEATVKTMPAMFPGEFVVQVLNTSGGISLVGAIELISPGNKDRPEAIRAFSIKCASYLQQGIGLLIIDIVTDRHANLHNELVDLLRLDSGLHFPAEALLYSISYRPFRSESAGDSVELRHVALQVARPLPVMPLALRGGPTVPVDLETSYTRARQRSKL